MRMTRCLHRPRASVGAGDLGGQGAGCYSCRSASPSLQTERRPPSVRPQRCSVRAAHRDRLGIRTRKAPLLPELPLDWPSGFLLREQSHPTSKFLGTKSEFKGLCVKLFGEVALGSGCVLHPPRPGGLTCKCQACQDRPAAAPQPGIMQKRPSFIPQGPLCFQGNSLLAF